MGTERNSVREDGTQQRNLLGRRQVGLIQGDELRNIRGALNRVDDRAHGLHLGNRVRVRRIDDMQDDVGLPDFLQGRTEGLDQLCG